MIFQFEISREIKQGTSSFLTNRRFQHALLTNADSNLIAVIAPSPYYSTSLNKIIKAVVNK